MPTANRISKTGVIMVKRGMVVVIALMVFMGGLAYWQVPAAQVSHQTLTPQDYMEIRQLYANYVRATDMGGGGDGSDYVANFTEDAEFEQPGRVDASGEFIRTQVKGHDGLKKMITGFHSTLKKNGWSSRHTYSGLHIIPTAEGAKGSVYALIFNVTATPPFVDHSGVYEDTLVKTTSGWKFKRRMFKPSGTYEPAMPLGLP